MNSRRSGVLLHLTSLPSPYGVGDLGKGAYDFIDFMERSGQSIWQVLPVGPVSGVCGNSPYCGYSAFAGNSLLISPDDLVSSGLLTCSDVEKRPSFSEDRVNFQAVADFKSSLLRVACERFRSRRERDCGFDAFCFANAHWLEDYALFVSIKERQGGVAWADWPAELRDRSEDALQDAREQLEGTIFLEKFTQYVFFRQWSALKDYCLNRNIHILGDVPIYVSWDSADVWANPRIFELDDGKKPRFVAGVPPDYFSETGQLWGNPVYRWDALRETGFSWWVKRMEHNLKLFDMARLDHFRGFVAFWQVPAEEKTAINGEWVDAPAKEFFDTLLRRFPHLPLIAEDLGIITSDVREIMTHFGFPGMKVLQFAFGGKPGGNPYAPHNHTRNCAVYTGTHDNNTTKGWFENEASEEEKKNLSKYIGVDLKKDRIHQDLTRLAMMSVGDIAIIPLQDLLGLGEEARMNTPSVTFGNWSWRVSSGLLTAKLADSILQMTRLYGRG